MFVQHSCRPRYLAHSDASNISFGPRRREIDADAAEDMPWTCQDRHGHGRGGAARSWSPEYSTSSRPSLPPTPPPRSPPPYTHASPAEQPDGGRVDAPGASRRAAQALCRRDPPVSVSSAAQTGPSPESTCRAPSCATAPSTPRHRRHHTRPTPRRGINHGRHASTL